jgi:hypothetical protein
VLSEGFGPGSFDLPDPTAGLTALKGYRASVVVSFDGTIDGAPAKWASTSTMLRNRDRHAGQLTVENTGDIPAPDPAWLLESAGTAYRRDAAGTCTAKPADPESSSLAELEPAGRLGGVIGGESIGHRVVAGIEADGYRFDERAVGQAGLAKSSGEVWVATDGGFVVSYDLTSTGGADLFGGGTEGTTTSKYELTDANVSVQIDVPDVCPPGLVQAPKLPDAANVIDAPGLTMYDTASTLADVLAFYDQQAPATGWTRVGDAAVGDTSATVDYTTGDGSVALIARKTAAGTRVNLLATTAPLGSGNGGGDSGVATGSVTLKVTGGHQFEATWELAAKFTSFRGFWTLTFQDPANPMPAGPFLTLILDPNNPILTFSDGRITIVDSAGACSAKIDHQDASGASGGFTCTGVKAIGASGPVDIEATFTVAA